MNETTFTKKLRDYIEDKGGGSIKLGASLFMAKGVPDTIFFIKGMTFFLESKVYPNTTSAIQKAQIERINKQGGFAWCVTYKDGIIKIDGQSLDIEGLFEYIFKHIRGYEDIQG